MLECIELACRIGARELSTRLKFYKKDDILYDSDDDTDITRDVMSGLEPCPSLNIMKIMGAIVHPMFQNKSRMVAAGLCTSNQYDAGRDELLSRLTRYHDSKLKNTNVSVSPTLEVQFLE